MTYWSFRLMIGLGLLTVAARRWSACGCSRRGRVPASAGSPGLAVLAVVAPFLANSFGWIFTEMGRQPWVVVPNPTGPDAVRMLTADGVSPSVGAATVLTSLITFTLLYAALAVVELRLLVRYAKAGPASRARRRRHRAAPTTTADRPLAFAY